MVTLRHIIRGIVKQVIFEIFKNSEIEFKVIDGKVVPTFHKEF
jgi:hypothetical protein